MAVHLFDVGSVCGVQVMPSGEVAASVEAAYCPPEIAQKTVPFQAMPDQRAEGIVRGVQATPLVDVAQTVVATGVEDPVPRDTAQYTVPFHTTALHQWAAGITFGWGVHETPSGEVPVPLPLTLVIATNCPPPQQIRSSPFDMVSTLSVDAGCRCGVQTTPSGEVASAL